MKQIKLSELKRLVKIGAAAEITDKNDIPPKYEKIGYSVGINGMNGGLIQDTHGQLYAVIGRGANLFILF